MTRSQRDKLQQLANAGGAAWMGPAIVDGRYRGSARYIKAIEAFFGKREGNRRRALLKKHGLKTQGVRASSAMISRLRDMGLIDRIDGIPSAYRLTDAGKSAIKL